jgi:hypothetical protein
MHDSMSAAATELDARGRRLRAALAAALVPGNAPELRRPSTGSRTD